MCAYKSYLFTLRIWFLSLSPFFLVLAILSFVPTGETILILPILKQKIQSLTDIASSSTTLLPVFFSKTDALKTLPASDFLPLMVFLGPLEGRFDLPTSTVTAYIRSSLACALSDRMCLFFPIRSPSEASRNKALCLSFFSLYYCFIVTLWQCHTSLKWTVVVSLPNPLSSPSFSH